MKCGVCGKECQVRSGRIQLQDKYIGEYSAIADEYFVCPDCNESYFPYSAMGRIDEARAEALERILQSLPLHCFVSLNNAAGILGITKQALSKNARVKRGFIFHTMFEEKPLYVRESVRRYSIGGDGRFPLSGYMPEYEDDLSTDSEKTYTAGDTVQSRKGSMPNWESFLPQVALIGEAYA